MKATGLSFVLGAVVCASFSWAASPLVEAKRLYFAAVDGDSDSIGPSERLFEKLAEERPADSVVTAYLGSIKLLRSSTTMAIWRKGKLANEGLRMLDQAVDSAPANLEVRFLRAASTFHLPGFFHREEESAADFARIASRVSEAAESGMLERRLASAALYFHGEILERHNNGAGAQDAWRRAVRVGPQTPAGNSAAGKLRQLTESRP